MAALIVRVTMNQKHRFRLCTYPAHEYRAAEVWLNEQAAEGWALESFYSFPLGIAKFVPTQRADLRYCIELINEKDRNDGHYLELCRDAGWEECPILTGKAWRMFRSIPGADPTPLQTDPAMELEAFFRKRLRWDFLALAIAIPLFILYFKFLFSTPYTASLGGVLFRFLSSGFGLSILLAAIVGIPVLLLELVSELRYWLRCRKVVREGLDFPIPNQRASRRWVWAQSVYRIFYLIYFVFLLLNLFDFGGKVYQPGRWTALREQPVVMAQDYGITDAELPCTLKDTSTPFYHCLDFEDLNSGAPDMEAYFAASETLAKLAVQGLLDNYYYVNLTPVDLGFDESYLSPLGEGGTYYVLLFRKGKTVALFTGTADWTDPEILSMLWERLRLEE